VAHQNMAAAERIYFKDKYEASDKVGYQGDAITEMVLGETLVEK
jgi:hypothetical protein